MNALLVDAPLNMEAPEGAYTIFYVLFGINVVATIAWLVWERRRSRTNVVLGAVAGGVVVGYFVPPVYNFLTKVWFPSNIPFPYIEAFGMKDPVFDLIGYASFIGVGGYLFMSMLRAGTPHAVTKTFAFWALTDLVLEIPFLRAGMYTYYGDQPFLIGGFPLHWVVINGTIPLVSGAVMYVLIDRGPRELLGPEWVRAGLSPIVAAGLMMIPIFPVALALHGDLPSGASEISAMLAIVVCGFMLRSLNTMSGEVNEPVLGQR